MNCCAYCDPTAYWQYSQEVVEAASRTYHCLNKGVHIRPARLFAWDLYLHPLIFTAMHRIAPEDLAEKAANQVGKGIQPV